MKNNNILNPLTDTVLTNGASEREIKLIGFYEEIERYVKHFELVAPTYNEFVELVENTRLTTHYDFDESIQVVCNELMPFRYSYSTFREY